MYDAVHHVNIGKCAPKDDSSYLYRKRRQADQSDEEQFDSIISELDSGFDGKGYGGGNAPKPNLLNKLDTLCRKFMATVWNAQEVQDCPKLGAWENRSKGLLDDMTAMKNICMNNKGVDQQGDMGYGK